MNTKVLRPPNRAFDTNQQNVGKSEHLKIYQNSKIIQQKHQAQQKYPQNAFPQQYPYEFSYTKNIIPSPNIQNVHSPITTINQRPIIISRANSPSLQPSITNHANPMGVKNPVLKHSGRPNSQDNKHLYLQNEKEHTKRRAQSQIKGEYREGDTSTSVKQPLNCHTNSNLNPNKSPLKPSNFNQYSQSHGQCHKTCPHSAFNPSQTFLAKCLQHIMIQNNCLNKQVVIKELELTRLRQELFKIKEKYLAFTNSSKFYTSQNLNSSFSSQSYKIHTESIMEQSSIKGLGEVKEEDDEFSDYSFVDNKEPASMQRQPNLQEIEQMIQQIENEERKLMKKSESFDVGLSYSKQTDEGEEKQYQITKQASQVIGKKNNNVNIDNDVNNWMEKDHKVEGMEFTRLDRLRMKKGLVSRREQFGNIK